VLDRDFAINRELFEPDAEKYAGETILVVEPEAEAVAA
jgi:hypothetical protein